MTKTATHSKHKFGLSFRINGVITVLLITVLAIATFSYRSLRDFSDQISLFSQQTLPALNNTITLTASLEEVVHGTESLMNSDIQASRRIAYTETVASLGIIRSSLSNNNNNIAESEELATIIDILSNTTEDLNKLIDERIMLADRARAVTDTIGQWVLNDLQTPEGDDAESVDPAYLSWFGQFRQLVISAGQVSGQNSARDQNRIIRASNRQMRTLERNIETLAPASRIKAQEQLEGFVTNYTSDGGLFEVQKALNGTTARSQALARQMQVLVAELLRKTEDLAASNSAQAQTASDQLAAKVKQQVTLFLIGAIFAIVVAALSYVFIGRQVIQRLLSLREAVTNRASGGEKPVPTDGNDEVTDIGEAVQYFIQEIDGRQQQLQANAQQLQSVIRLSPQAMCIATETEILYFNEAYISVWDQINPGIPFDYKLGHAGIPDKLLLPSKAGDTIHVSRHAVKGTSRIVQWFDLASSSVEWHGTPARQIVIVDVTKQVQVEHTLEEARRKAEAAAQSKSNFLAMMSHEIRSPMNGIISVGEILEGSNLNKEQRELVQVINQSAETLLTILNDILDLSKIEAGKLEIATADFELASVIQGVANLLTAAFEQKGLTLKVQVDPDVPKHIHSDENRIRQILFNLLGNALKFTESGHVNVNASLVTPNSKNEPLIRISVKDTGVGIAPEVIERLFQPFEQADSTTARQYGGTGLGLSICKRLAELLDGEIKVDSSVGKGSEFVLDIPLQIAVADEDTPTLTNEQSLETEGNQLKRILVVEDNKVNQLVIGKILKSLGYQWDTADDGLNALELFDRKTHDLILTDLRMPRMDGFALARAIRSDEEKGTRIPIVALSADAMDEARKLSQQSGIDAFLTKPVKVDDVRQCLNSF
ncbi:ATP-binding protein [Kordiimonas aquimaris]|uniref:ATP-binding protein n=1 Tax=Kordiimonas aquimaris TaxID=707591 RepID=UPI0021D11E0D|nr:ATP-binding protein [Kordiimonas aquimaris]